MNNEVWEKVATFLMDLRCSDMQRSGLVHLKSCLTEKEKLKELQGQFDRYFENMFGEEQEIIGEYIKQLQQVAFEEQQEAYCQGIVDALRILSGLQLLPLNENIQKLIDKLR